MSGRLNGGMMTGKLNTFAPDAAGELACAAGNWLHGEYGQRSARHETMTRPASLVPSGADLGTNPLPLNPPSSNMMGCQADWLAARLLAASMLNAAEFECEVVYVQRTVP